MLKTRSEVIGERIITGGSSRNLLHLLSVQQNGQDRRVHPRVETRIDATLCVYFAHGDNSPEPMPATILDYSSDGIRMTARAPGDNAALYERLTHETAFLVCTIDGAVPLVLCGDARWAKLTANRSGLDLALRFIDPREDLFAALDKLTRGEPLIAAPRSSRPWMVATLLACLVAAGLGVSVLDRDNRLVALAIATADAREQLQRRPVASNEQRPAMGQIDIGENGRLDATLFQSGDCQVDARIELDGSTVCQHSGIKFSQGKASFSCPTSGPKSEATPELWLHSTCR